LKSTVSLPRPNRRYRITDPGQAVQQGSPSSQPSDVTDLTTFFSLAFELEVHLFSDSFHAEARPVRAGAGGSSIARHFRLGFDGLGISEDDTYNDGRPMRGGNVSKGQRIITKHVVIGSNDLLNDHLDVASVTRPLVLELRVLAHPPLRDHSNIIDLFGVAWEKESDRFDRLWPILVLEYAPGGNLAEYLSLNDHHITWPIWQKLLEDLASALCLLHKCGVIHADIKPENILVDMGKDGRPIANVCDFGFAIIRSDYTEGPSHDPEIQLIGFTPKWMAPEVRSGRVRISQAPSIDVYALGLVAACVAIGGRDPFDIDVRSSFAYCDISNEIARRRI
jgi:Protein kinase domain